MLALAALAWGQALPAVSRYASIVGVVLDDTTGAPVPRAVVKLQTKTAEPSDAVAWTDGRGAFSFAWVPPGQYFLFAHRDGYEMARLGTVRREQPPEVLSLASGEDRRIVLRMRPVGSISGAVYDPDGDPAPGVNVRLLVAGYNRRKLRYLTRNAAMTDSRGRYRLGSLPPGKYVLMAIPQAWPPPAAKPEVVRGQAAEEARYAPEFYPNADGVAAATPIVLAAGKNLEGFDFHLSLQPVAKIEGKVILPDDAGPDAHPTVMIYAEDDIGAGGLQGAGVNPADNAFEVRDVLPGRYRVTSTLSAQGRQYRGVEHVDVGRSPVSVTLRLEPGVELSGSVRLEGDPGGDPPHFRVWLVPGDDLPYNSPPEAWVKPDGSFRLAGVLPGVWDIGVEPVPKGGYIKSMSLGDQDVLTEDMVISPETSEPLNIVVSTRGAVVDGFVAEAGGERAKKAYVLLAPAGRQENVWTFYQVVPADENGGFEFKSVRPGAYRLYALARMDTNPSQDPDFLKRLGGRGETVDVAEGAHVTRELRLIPEAALEPEAK